MRDTAGIPYVGGGSDRERVFRAATRHSRMVRFFRRAIPVSLIVILLSIAAAAYFQPLRMIYKLPLDAGRLVVSGTKITMEAPHLAGFTRDGRPYDLTARAAAQDITNPGVLELKDVRAHVAMQDQAVIELRAAAGLYDTKADAIVLKTDVTLTSTAGYTVRLNEAKVDIKTNKIVSEMPVEVTLSNGTINANRLEVSDNGDTMRFENGVEVYLVPQTAAGTTDTTTPAAGPNTGSNVRPKTGQ
jgi:lipopolysaccharide export system protein LptC